MTQGQCLVFTFMQASGIFSQKDGGYVAFKNKGLAQLWIPNGFDRFTTQTSRECKSTINGLHENSVRVRSLKCLHYYVMIGGKRMDLVLWSHFTGMSQGLLVYWILLLLCVSLVGFVRVDVCVCVSVNACESHVLSKPYELINIQSCENRSCLIWTMGHYLYFLCRFIDYKRTVLIAPTAPWSKLSSTLSCSGDNSSHAISAFTAYPAADNLQTKWK